MEAAKAANNANAFAVWPLYSWPTPGNRAPSTSAIPGRLGGRATATADIGGGSGGYVSGGVVTGLGRKFTKRGDQMAVFVLEDLEATIEVTVFPRMLQEQGHKLEDDIIVAVKGRLDKRDESRFGLIALDIQVLAGLAETAAASLRLALPSHALDELRIQRLKRILRDHPGDSVVLIELGRGKVLRLSDEFRVDIDRAVGELRMAFGHDAVLL